MRPQNEGSRGKTAPRTCGEHQGSKHENLQHNDSIYHNLTRKIDENAKRPKDTLMYWICENVSRLPTDTPVR
jgi:hypothetical protein